MKKPVAKKRRGYDSGGIVSAGQRLYGQIRDIGSDRSQESNLRQAGIDRGAAKDYPGMESNFQSADIVGDRMLARQGMPTKYPASQPEGYPAPTSRAKGGPVKKVIPAKKVIPVRKRK